MSNQKVHVVPAQTVTSDDYQRKYELLVAYVDGVSAMASQSNDMSAEQAMDAISNYIEQLNKLNNDK